MALLNSEVSSLACLRVSLLKADGTSPDYGHALYCGPLRAQKHKDPNMVYSTWYIDIWIPVWVLVYGRLCGI